MKTRHQKFTFATPAALLVLAFVSGSLGAAQSNSITLTVDATEAARRVFHSRLLIPAKAGPLTLYYPKWIPGEHGPTGPINEVAGLHLTAGGKEVAWQRDLLEMYAIHCQVPAGAEAVEVAMDFLSPSSVDAFFGSSGSAQLTVINWNQLLWYPAGQPTGKLTYTASLRLPSGWKFGTALPVAKESPERIEFAPASLYTLVDSPVLTGAHLRTLDLSPGTKPPHLLHVAADSPAALELSPALLANHRRLVTEARTLFGAQHYQRYHFLLALTDHVPFFGLEHHESSDNRVAEHALIDEGVRLPTADLLPHEFAHSWNGKFRRPADLTTTIFHEPMRTDLLWVYEGLTQYLGGLLAVRSGLWTAETYREVLAWYVASLDHQSGRQWRPLSDTATAAPMLYEARREWAAWRRGVDFYPEGALIWLEADTLIRQQTQNRQSLDDFCRRFCGGQSGSVAVSTYTFDDVVAMLNKVTPYDWRGFFTNRLSSTERHAPAGGIQNGGWRLVFSDTPNDYLRADEQANRVLDLTCSIGLKLQDDGTVLDVIPELPAAKAGVAPAMKVIAVNSRKWSAEVMREALKASKTVPGPLELLVENNDFLKTHALDYHDGERHPHLERETGKPDMLQQIFKPLGGAAK